MLAPLLDISDLSLTIDSAAGPAFILDRCRLQVREGEVMGLVGESGCGKSTIVKAILGVLPPGACVTSGSIRVAGRDLVAMDEASLIRDIRGKLVGFIPQDPAQALNPNFRVGEQLLEIWRWHGDGPRGAPGRRQGRDRLIELLRRVQIPDPEQVLDRYPHQFSGGQRQRLLIAAALLCRPKLIVADEPTTALDVTTQQQILALLADLARDFKVAVLFVTHDFGVVSQLCDRVTVMYAGQTVEQADKRLLLKEPKHPYSRALLDCHPDRMTSLRGIPGTVPRLVNPPEGCRFVTRCPQAQPQCHRRVPNLADGAHTVDCRLFDRISGLESSPNGQDSHA
jgi:peptide/nickel transport system ATP-binding protein